MNYKEVERIENFAIKNNFMYAIRPYMDGLGDFSKYNKELTYDSSFEGIIRLYESFKKNALKRNYLAYLVYKNEPIFFKNRYNGDCDAVKYSMLVNSDGSISPCLEKPKLSITASAEKTLLFLRSKKVRSIINLCNKTNPCFHGCGRNIGILMENRLRIIFNLSKIIYLSIKYNSFW